MEKHSVIRLIGLGFTKSTLVQVPKRNWKSIIINTTETFNKKNTATTINSSSKSKELELNDALSFSFLATTINNNNSKYSNYSTFSDENRHKEQLETWDTYSSEKKENMMKCRENILLVSDEF